MAKEEKNMDNNDADGAATSKANDNNAGVGGISDEEAEAMANAALAEAGLKVHEAPTLPDFTSMLKDAVSGSIEMLNDVEMNVKIELGRAEMEVDQVLRLTTGSVIELDKHAGDPVDILVNEKLVARGEVLVINDNFCVRINEIIPGVTERFAALE